MSTPIRALSKGTLGLKFMNRSQNKPVGQGEAPSPAPSKSSSSTTPANSRTTSAPQVASAEPVLAKVEQKDVSSTNVVASESLERAPVASTSGRQIVRESSLLSFPMLSAASTPFTSSSLSYSSMPLTSSLVSGRTSFGGFNADIERLNNPIPPSAPSVNIESGDSNQKKKRRKGERDNISLNVRESSKPNFTGKSGSGSFDANSDELRFGGGSSSNTKGKKNSAAPVPPSREFKRPQGFEDLKKGGGAKRGKGQDVEPVWGKRGSERAWDIGKDESDLSAEEDEEEDEEQSEDEDDSDSDSDVADWLGASTSKARESHQKHAKGEIKPSPQKRDITKAIDESEGGWAGDNGGGQGSSKKRRRKNKNKQHSGL
ncbi:hypothetical protein T439DRAFT_384313 [Meredithblackwellia eburnea MCA 4105]